MVGRDGMDVAAVGTLLRSGLLRLARSAAGLVWLSALAATALVIAAQCVYWLKHATWPGWSVADGLALAFIAKPTLSWLGLQRVLDWLISLPLGVGVLLLGAVAGNFVWRLSALILGIRRVAK